MVGGPRVVFGCEERWLKSGSNSPVEVGSLSHDLQGFIQVPSGAGRKSFIE